MAFSNLTDFFAQESRCADRDIWKTVSFYVVIPAVVVSGLLLFYGAFQHRERKDTLMERITQTYILLRIGWRSDCEYSLTRFTGNEYATNTDDTKDDKRVKALPEGVIDNTDGSSDTLDLIDKSNTVENDDKLIKALHQRNIDRVLFVGEPGIGKSHLFQSIARKWAEGKILKDVILIYLQLDHVPKRSCILKEFLKMLQCENSEKEIYSLILELKRKKSIVLLDGISNWSRFCYTTSNNANGNVHFLTIEELLETNNNKFEKMKVWVTSRNVDADMKVMKGNYTKVNLNGLNEEQREKFFKKFVEMEIHEQRNVQQRYKSKLFDEIKNIKTILCNKDVLTRSPVVLCFLAKMFCSEESIIKIKSTVETHLTKFPNMVETTWDLIESEKVDFDLLICLLEVGGTDDNDYRTCAYMLHMKTLVFNHIKHEYFQEAMLRLLMTLRETQRVITSLTVYGECPIKLFSCLPKIKQRLVFYNVSFTEIDFIAVIETISQHKLTLEFHDSDVAETFPVITLLDNYATTNLSVFRYNKNENRPAKLSWKEGVWTDLKTGEDISHSVEENRPKEQDNEQTEASHH